MPARSRQKERIEKSDESRKCGRHVPPCRMDCGQRHAAHGVRGMTHDRCRLALPLVIAPAEKSVLPSEHLCATLSQSA